MTIRTIGFSLLLLALSGCELYAGFIPGYSEDGGDYFTYHQTPIREDGGSAIVYMGGRRQLSEHVYAVCQGTHFSTFFNRPEVAVNHVGCGVEVR